MGAEPTTSKKKIVVCFFRNGEFYELPRKYKFDVDKINMGWVFKNVEGCVTYENEL